MAKQNQTEEERLATRQDVSFSELIIRDEDGDIVSEQGREIASAQPHVAAPSSSGDHRPICCQGAAMANRQGILIRIGIDSSAGDWNAPVDPDTLEFVYVPIPEKATTQFQTGMRRPYTEVKPSLHAFCESRTVRTGKAQLPPDLDGRCMHLDPDFEHLTYGDLGPRRGKPLRKLRENDLVIFYAGLRPCREPHKLIYALVGMYLVDRVAEIADVEPPLWAQNAHTRKLVHGKSDVIVWGKPEGSGRFRAAIPFGGYRDGAYRIRPDVLEAWGGISANDGYIQRSGALPRLNDAERCLQWIRRHGVELERRNF